MNINSNFDQNIRLLIFIALTGVIGVGLIAIGIQRPDSRFIRVGVMNWIIVIGVWGFLPWSNR